MKIRRCLQCVVLCLSFLFIAQTATAGFKSWIADVIIKTFGEEIVNIHRSVGYGEYLYFPITLQCKDEIMTYIKVSNGVPVDIDLLQSTDFEKYKKGREYSYFQYHHGKGIIQDRYYFPRTSCSGTSKETFYLVINNPSKNRKSSNVKVEVYKDGDNAEK